MSAWMSEKPIAKSGFSFRISPILALVKAETFGFSFRARDGRTVKPLMPTMRSDSPSAYSTSVGSSVRQMIRRGPRIQYPMNVALTVRICGAARCSHRYTPCQVPSASSPLCTGRLRLTPVRIERTCAGMSSGPSASCRNSGSPSRTSFAKKRSRSSRTTGSAFSQISSEQLVCCVNTCATPSRNPLSASPVRSLSSSSTKPRPRVRTSKLVVAMRVVGREGVMSEQLSGIKQTLAPLAANQFPTHALIQAMHVRIPELDHVRRHPIAAPVRRARNLAVLEFLFTLLDARFQQLAIRQRAGLLGSPCAELAQARTGREINIRFLLAQLFRAALDTHLGGRLQMLPVQRQCDLRMRLDRLRLFAAVIGEEGES